MKRHHSPHTPIATKKQKIDKILQKNYSPLLTQPFTSINSLFQVHLHHLIRCPSFGLLLPFIYPPNTQANYIKTIQMPQKIFFQIQKFQNKFWHDLKKSQIIFESPTVSEANYLVVPMNSCSISMKTIEACLENTSLKCSDVPENERNKYVWSNKGRVIVKYLKTVPNEVDEFFRILLGKEHPKLGFYCKKFEGRRVLDVIKGDDVDVQAVRMFKFKDSEICIDQLAFVKTARSVVYNPELYSKQTFFDNGTPFVHIDQLVTFYLNKEEYNQLFTLIDSLIKLEQFSRTIEFSQKLNYQGNLNLLHQAMTSSSADHTYNYESLETVGDSILKFLVSLSIFIKFPEKPEHHYSDLRSHIVSNKYLSNIAKKHDLSSSITTFLPSHAKFVPPYFYSPKNVLYTEQLITDNVLADFVEAIIGCFYVGENLMRAAKFLQDFGIIDNLQQISKFLEYGKKPILMKNFEFGDKFQQLFQGVKGRVRGNSVEVGRFKYVFRDFKRIRKALTHFSVNEEENYEKFEFLGDAVLDLIVVSSIYSYKAFDPGSLSALKQLLVCNQHLSCISILSNLYKYLNSSTLPLLSREDYSTLQQTDLFSLSTIPIPLNKQQSDIIESLIGSILIDSQSLEQSFCFISELLSPSISYALTFHTIYLYTQSAYFKTKIKQEPCIKCCNRI